VILGESELYVSSLLSQRRTGLTEHAAHAHARARTDASKLRAGMRQCCAQSKVFPQRHHASWVSSAPHSLGRLANRSCGQWPTSFPLAHARALTVIMCAALLRGPSGSFAVSDGWHHGTVCARARSAGLASAPYTTCSVCHVPARRACQHLGRQGARHCPLYESQIALFSRRVCPHTCARRL
jgi:hypothetical protein